MSGEHTYSADRLRSLEYDGETFTHTETRYGTASPRLPFLVMVNAAQTRRLLIRPQAVLAGDPEAGYLQTRERVVRGAFVDYTPWETAQEPRGGPLR